ncbi:MAG: LamG domain-containing protein [Cyanobacteria bacterium P01_D01_bin.105]
MATPPTPTFSGKQPVAYLNFNEGSGSLAKDSSSKGRDNSGRLVGDAKWMNGISGGAITLDGVGDFVALKDSKDINKGRHLERTVSLWFKADKIDTGSKKQVLYEEGASYRGLNIYLDQAKLYVGGWNRDSKQSNWSGTWLSTDKISAGKWHHVDLVLDGGKQVSENAIHGYLDGQKFGSGSGSRLWSHSGDIGIGSINGQTRFHDGLMPSSGSGFAGAIDEVMIFNDVLNSNDIQSFI